MIPPLYHSAIGHLLGPVVVGAQSVLLTEAISPQIIFETMAREQVSVVFLLVPWTLDILGALDRGELRLAEYDLSRWRLMHMGAQPIRLFSSGGGRTISRRCNMIPATGSTEGLRTRRG